MRYSYLDIRVEESKPYYRYNTDTFLNWDEEDYNDDRYWNWEKGKDGKFKYATDAYGEQILLAFTEEHPFYNWFKLVKYSYFGVYKSYACCKVVEEWFLRTYKPKGFKIP